MASWNIKDEQKAREIVQRWKWELDTSRGDLCPHCARMRVLGMLERPEQAPPQESRAESRAQGSEFWRKILLFEKSNPYPSPGDVLQSVELCHAIARSCE